MVPFLEGSPPQRRSALGGYAGPAPDVSAPGHNGPVRARLLLVLPVLVVLLVPVGPAGADPVVPPSDRDFDYQLGGNRGVPDRVGIVVRDREAAPLSGAYNVCYVNGFQTQPHERRFWRDRWRLVLKEDGRPVSDSAWGEWLLDIRTDRKRRALARVVGRWVEGCAEDGYDAVEYDNLDSFSRSRGMVSRADARDYARRLVRRAHAQDLAAAQKNWASWDGTAVGFDFAVAEDCARWRECGEYVDHYGALVLDVEYHRKPFRRACRHWDDRLAVVRRDLPLAEDGLRRYC